ncbi:MAG: hypothetical protein GY762_08360 [Proteobacteria bacterium]|nr:hypothetical protein [Pseudomonadota bacterium]
METAPHVEAPQIEPTRQAPAKQIEIAPLPGLDTTTHTSGDKSAAEPSTDGPGVTKPGMDRLSEADRMSGLELASYAPTAPQPRGSATKAESKALELAARDMANFGIPDSGFVGSIKYWLRVRRRLKELSAQHEKAVATSQSSTSQMHTLLAELGRNGHAIGIKNEKVVSLISRASIEQGELKGAQRLLQELETEYKAALQPLEADRKIVEAETIPIKEQEKEALDVLEKLVVDRKRIEAKLKRAQIELRNLDELVGKRQENYAEPDKPEEERAKLFSEITAFENKRPALEEQVRAGEEELAVLAKPIAEAEAELEKIRGALSEKLNKINFIDTEIKALTASHKEKSNQQAIKTTQQSEKVETAWAVVGETIITEQCDEQELKELKAKAIGSMDGDTESKKQVALFSIAMDCFDHDVVSRAKVYSIVGLIGVVALIVLLLIFLG